MWGLGFGLGSRLSDWGFKSKMRLKGGSVW